MKKLIGTKPLTWKEVFYRFFLLHDKEVREDSMLFIFATGIFAFGAYGSIWVITFLIEKL